MLLHHVSPLDGKTYLAGYARTTESWARGGGWTGWCWCGTRRRRRWGRSSELRDEGVAFRLLTYGLTAALMAGLWAWLFWLMRRQDSLAKA